MTRCRIASARVGMQYAACTVCAKRDAGIGHDDESDAEGETERLIVREIDGETLVYDRSRDAASCLNEFAARVWRECDGETSVAAIAAALSEDERAVWLALHQLTKAQLLTEAIAFPPDMSAAKSRREIAGAVGVGRGGVRHQHRRADASTSRQLFTAPRALHTCRRDPCCFPNSCGFEGEFGFRCRLPL